MARASSPVVAPPARTQSPAPTPINNAPTTEARRGRARDTRPQGREQLADGIAGGIAAGGDGGVGDEGFAQRSPPQNVAGDVQNEAADGGESPNQWSNSSVAPSTPPSVTPDRAWILYMPKACSAELRKATIQLVVFSFENFNDIFADFSPFGYFPDTIS